MNAMIQQAIAAPPRLKGFLMVLLAASLWGISGTVAQRLFQLEGINPGWLTTVRLIVSGSLLLLVAKSQSKDRSIRQIWKDRHDRRQVLIFGLFGMVGAQYTYFAAIQAGNAAVATVLQYLAPLFIILYMAVRAWRLPDTRQLLALATAVSGTFLLVTDGSFEQLSVPLPAVIWGIVNAMSVAFYSLYPKRLLQQWGSTLIVGWAMLIGGFGMALFHPPWAVETGHWSLSTVVSIVFIIIFGTLIPFCLYLDSLRYITPAVASLLTSAEPLSALLVSVIWLRLSLGAFEAIGALLIVVTVMMLSVKQGSRGASSTDD
jgi:drug/metabolite transporter (DMT)-like permease